MISYIKGQVLLREPGRIILNTGTMGFSVYLDQKTELKIGGVGSEEELYTFQVFRDGEPTLFGFDTLLKLEAFELLLNANKVGPRTALSVLSVLSPEELLSCLIDGEVKGFGKIPGVGKKLLSQMLLDCADGAGRISEKYGIKITVPNVVEEVEKPVSDPTVEGALRQLGFTATEVKRSLKHISGMKDFSGLDQEGKISECLKYFYQNKK